MNADVNMNMDPNFVPDEYKIPYDVIELPSQGILYPNKKSSVKVEYFTTMDENILTSPNLANSGKIVDILLERKIKGLGFPSDELLDGDRMAILIFLRVTAFGPLYKQPVVNPLTSKVEIGEIDLSTLKQKQLVIQPDDMGEFDYVLPHTKVKAKFRILTGKDESEIDTTNNSIMEREGDGVSHKTTLRLEREIMEINGIRDKMRLSNIIKNMSPMDSRPLRKYISDIEPGIDFNTTARTPGGESIKTFLRLGSNFLWPEL
tara:strand:+ start:926 stop:1708 length:783 start_codon:yes stop_codon:yes gene_type:complete